MSVADVKEILGIEPIGVVPESPDVLAASNAGTPVILNADSDVARAYEDALFRRTSSTASVAKERLRIIVAQQRTTRGGPDYLPLLRRELLEVIRKYVNVDPDAIQIHLENEDGHEVLELSVALPEKAKS